MIQLNSYIDHTLLKATATPDEISNLCKEAIKYNFYAVCINSCYVFLASNELRNANVKIVATIGFPLGTSSTKSKREEAKRCIKDGADEIDMVINVGFLKANLHKSVCKEISSIKKTIGKKILKVILETCYLTDEEIKIACHICALAGADYVKTSTGFGSGGATIHAAKLMLEEIGSQMKVKASGGIRDAKTALEYINLGVSRIGTSNGVVIVSNLESNQ